MDVGNDAQVHEKALANGWGWVLGVEGERLKRPTNRQAGAKKRLRTLAARSTAGLAHAGVTDALDRLRAMPYAEYRADRRLVTARAHLEAASRCLFLFSAAIHTIEPPDPPETSVQVSQGLE